MRHDQAEDLRRFIRDVPDFPKPGILFKDISPLLADPAALRLCLDLLAERVAPLQPQAVVGIESRGFIFGAALAARLGLGFVPARKPGKLPAATHRVEYGLEYGTDALELHRDGLRRGERALVVDDLIATGGTARATAELLARCGAELAGFAFVVDLAFLGGCATLAPAPCVTLLEYA
jgi:adenine phosphoribosyltransferase